MVKIPLGSTCVERELYLLSSCEGSLVASPWCLGFHVWRKRSQLERHDKGDLMRSGIRLEATSYVCIYIHMNVCIFTLTLKCEYIYIYSTVYIHCIYLSTFFVHMFHQPSSWSVFSLKSCSFLSLSLTTLWCWRFWGTKIGPQCQSGESTWATKKKKKILLSMKYWLFNTDPYNGLLQSPHNWLV